MSPTPPAFQFYARDFLAAVASMSLEERGAYITFLAQAWDQVGIPTQPERQARMLGVSVEDLERVWPAIASKWKRGRRGMLTNARLEQQRDKQLAWRDKSAAGGRVSKPASQSGNPKGGSSMVETKREPNPKRTHAVCKQQGEEFETNEVKNGSVAHEVLVEFNACAGTNFTSKKFLSMIRKRVGEHPGLTLEAHRGIIQRNLAAPWWEGTPSPNVIYGSEDQFERAMHSNGQGKRHPADLQFERYQRMAETA